MCGIVGILAFNDEGKKYLSKISAATSSLYQRGPDDEKLYILNNVALGHRRLAIIDTSAKGSQPMSDVTGRYTIVFNGEIFNYKELRKHLLDKGVVFHSESDTEVLLYLYIHYQEKCLEKLDGEFAFSIYDKETNRLFIARDRFGIKPLYYYKDNDKFIFASELKAILQFNVKTSLDTTSLHTYLHLNYIPSPYSIFNEVKKLSSGKYMFISNTGGIEIQNYYQLPEAFFERLDISYDDAKNKLGDLLSNSVKNRMISDVPLGTFLSGGIDSSIITGIAARHTQHLNTFSIGFKDEPFFDETHYAEIVAKKFNTHHTVFSLSTNDLFENLQSTLNYLDEPFADSSALAVNILSMHTRKHVTVALSGDGADELFGGYNKHAAAIKSLNGNWTNLLVKNMLPVWKLLPKSRNSKAGNKIRQIYKFSKGLSLNEKERYWRWAGFTEEAENNLLDIAYNRNDYQKRKADTLHNVNTDFNSWLYTDMKLVLENDMLVKADRMSMANSLEVRVPFMDHTLVNYVMGLPANYKIDRTVRKKILKDAFKTLLPPEIMNRNKQGFEVPLLKWFRTDLKSLITDELLNDNFIREQNIFNPLAVKQLKQQLFSSSPDDSVAKVWGLIVFQHWWKKYGTS